MKNKRGNKMSSKNQKLRAKIADLRATIKGQNVIIIKQRELLDREKSECFFDKVKEFLLRSRDV